MAEETSPIRGLEDGSEQEPETDESQEAQSDDPLADDPELQQALLKLYQKCSAEDRYPRLIEVKDVKQAENYWAGRQYDWWSRSEQTWKPITTATGGANQGGDIDSDDMPRFQFVTNIYQATGLTVIGAVAGAPPRIRFFPEDADEDKDLITAEGRTKLTKLIQRWNPPQKLLQEEAYHAWTSGFICWWSRYVPNGEKYGIDSVSLLSQGSQDVESTIHCPECNWEAPADQAKPPIPCPQCGHPLTEEDVSEGEPIPVPEEGGETEIPKGRQVISVFGALNCKRPQHTDDQSRWHYFAIEREIHYSTLRGAYQDKSDKIKPGMVFGPDDVFERNARLSIAENTKTPTQTAQAMANLVTTPFVWFRPTAFWMIDDKDQRDKLLEKFPRGCRVEFAGNEYCASEAESMDDAIVSCHAMPGRGQHRPGLGTSMMSVQDRFNTFTNIEAETYEYGIPITYRAEDTFSQEADEDQRAAPGLEIGVALNPNTDIRQKIMQTRADSVSPDMAKHTMDLMGPVTQYLSGAFPALTGATEDQPNTLGQQAMQRDQAMGRMGVPYVNLKQAHADVMTISCRCFEAHAEGIIKIPVFGQSGDFESESVDVTALEGEAEAYPEGDENFPELWNQQRATMMQIMDTPYGQALAKEPGNAELFGKMTGIPDLKIPGLASWRKQLKEISELTKIPQGEEDNPLEPVAPFVEVDSDDFHDIESACCKWWLNSEQGQKMKRENPPGWMAVKQHKAQHDVQIPKEPPPQKPLSESVTAAFKDMPPEAQAQVLEQWGIHVTPQDFLDGLMMKKAAEKPKPMPGQPQPGGPQHPPAAGVQ